RTTQGVTSPRGAHGDAVDVDASWDGGAHWRTISANTPGTNFNWTVTRPISAHCRIRVSDITYPQRYDWSDANFTVTDSTGRADVPPASREASWLSPGLPSPFAGQVRFLLRAPREVLGEVTVFDAAG